MSPYSAERTCAWDINNNLLSIYCRLKKKKTQRESCELSFIWGKMRTIAQETVSQIALR